MDTPTAPEGSRGRDLTVVMPVYNEEASLPRVTRGWLDTLDATGIDYRLLVLDDGSTDRTPQALAQAAEHPRLTGISKDNEGHGPTILRGYQLAVEQSDWVFQVDSDDEIPASAFTDVWAARHGVDAVFGRRTGRDQTSDRALVTRVAGLTARILLRGQVADANVPFRLMRAQALAPVIAHIPASTFAPNVVIAGVLSRDRARFAEVPVPHRDRTEGEVSIAGWGVIGAAARSFLQTLRLAWRLR